MGGEVLSALFQWADPCMRCLLFRAHCLGHDGISQADVPMRVVQSNGERNAVDDEERGTGTDERVLYSGYKKESSRSYAAFSRIRSFPCFLLRWIQ